MKTRTCVVFILAVALFLGAGWGQSAAAARAPIMAARPAAYNCSSATGILQADCEALVALYNSTNGAGWTVHTDWLVTNTPCSWYGVSCDANRATALALSSNQLTGTIPIELGNLTSLLILDLTDNQLSGTIPPQLGNLVALRWLKLSSNALNGSIPAQLGSLADLEWLELNYNSLSSAIPTQLGGLANLLWLNLYGNQLSGSIPVQLGNLAGLQLLSLGFNQLSGTIPAQLGNLANLTTLTLADNALEGEIPAAFINLTRLDPNDTDFGFNKLTASSPAVVAFLNSQDPDWAQTQTVPPANGQAAARPVNSVELTWTPIPYTGDGGYYEIGYSTTPGGPYSIHGQTLNKSASSYPVSNLLPDTTYYFVMRTYTPAHGTQQNNLLSGWSSVVVFPKRYIFLPLVLR